MSATHHIDDINKIIITDWKGNADLDKFVHSYNRYLVSIRAKQEYDDYNELVNFSDARNLNFNLQDLKKYAKIAASFDQNQPKRMALVVNQGKAYVLARGYSIIRKLVPGSRKKVNVFLDYFEALEWINSKD